MPKVVIVMWYNDSGMPKLTIDEISMMRHNGQVKLTATYEKLFLEQYNHA